MANIAYASLLLFIFAIPWEQVIVIPGLGTATRVFGLLAVPLGLLAIVGTGRHRFPWPLALLAAFVALAALSLLWTHDVEGGFSVLQTYVQLLVMTWLALQLIDSEPKLHGAFLAYILGGYVAAGHALYAYMTGFYESYLRYVAEGMGPNNVALNLAVAIAMAGYLGICRRGWWRLIALGFIPLGIYGVLLTASRAGFLAMLIAVSLPFLLMLRPRHFAKAFVLGSAGLVVGAMLLVHYVPESSWARISTIDTAITEGSLNGRLVIWSAGLEMINEAPILGVGISSYDDMTQRLVGWRKLAHNGFLSIAAQFGVVGLLLVLAAWTLVVRNILSMPAQERLAWYVILGVLLMAVMSTNWEAHKMTWLLFVMALVHARYTRPRPRPRPATAAAPELAARHAAPAFHGG